MLRSLGITLDPTDGTTLYRQIFDQVVERIHAGSLPAGFRLPATRALSAELGTTRNTVVRAYEELSSAGFTRAGVGRGTFVADEIPARAGAVAMPAGEAAPLRWASLVSVASNAEPLRRGDRLSRSVRGGDPINLTRMQPPAELLPDELLRRCIDHVLKTLGPKALGYAPREGVLPLRRLIADELGRAGVPARTESVIITTGSQQALDLCARVLIDPGDPFLVDESTYTGAINLLSAAGARLIAVPSDEEGPDPAALKRLAGSGAKGFYLMPSCGNPTGRSVSAARREAIVAWSREAGVPLIEDDYGADLYLDGTPPPPALRSLDADVIYVGTYSKKLIPALRVGFMVCPDGLSRHLLPLKHTMDLGTSALLQHALAEFIDRGYLRAHLRRIQPIYRERRDALAAGLAEHLPPTVRWQRPKYGLVQWLELPVELDPEEVFEVAQRHGVLVSPGTLNSVGGSAPARGGLRLVFCGEPPERLRMGAERLGAAIRETMGLERSRHHEPRTRFGVV